MAKRLLVSIGMVLLLVRPVPAQSKYQDPDSPAGQAAARAALANAKVLDIIGVSSGLKGVMEDLGAKVTDQEITIELAADFLFDFDKYVLKTEAIPSLQKVGEVVKAYPKAPVLVEGHTDGKGTHPYNMKLSENRALSVKNWLVQNAGVDPARITTRVGEKPSPSHPIPTQTAATIPRADKKTGESGSRCARKPDRGDGERPARVLTSIATRGGIMRRSCGLCGRAAWKIRLCLRGQRGDK